MLDYTVLRNKKLIERTGPNDNAEEQYDLMTKVVDNVDIDAFDIIVVNEYYVARPDLISLAVYGTDQYADIICKFNGISNPFEVNEDDIIYLPDINQLNNMFNEDDIKVSDFIDNEKTSSLVEKEHKFQKYPNETRSPAEQLVGETNFVIDKTMGVVFY